MGRENPHEWFTAGEVADLARRFGVEGFPATKRGVNKWLRRQELADPDGFGKKAAKLTRPRTGREGGGGLEYHRFLFHRAGKAMAVALESGVKLRLAEVTPPCENPLQLDFDDHRLMLSAIGIKEGYIALRLGPLKTRIVRRKYIVIDYRQYYLGRGMDGQTVLAAQARHPTQPEVALAFVWRLDPVHGGLLAHGAPGFIRVAEADPMPDNQIAWESILGQRLGARPDPDVYPERD